MEIYKSLTNEMMDNYERLWHYVVIDYVDHVASILKDEFSAEAKAKAFKVRSETKGLVFFAKSALMLKVLKEHAYINNYFSSKTLKT